MEGNSLELSVGAWSAGIEYEARFWNNWAKTQGGKWPQRFIDRLKEDRELALGLQALLPPFDTVRVLDVGAGPVTTLGSRCGERNVELIATDPLAQLYDHILSAANLDAPIRTVFATAEDLSSFFNASSFDLVHCQNALDHSFDPVRGIEEMLRVAKIGGYVELRHAKNEAEREQYHGFHQYNFDQSEGRFRIWNKSGSIFPDEVVSCKSEFKVTSSPLNDWITVTIKKTGEFADPSDNSRYRARVRDLTEGLISYFVSETFKRLKTAGVM